MREVVRFIVLMVSVKNRMDGNRVVYLKNVVTQHCCVLSDVINAVHCRVRMFTSITQSKSCAFFRSVFHAIYNVFDRKLSTV